MMNTGIAEKLMKKNKLLQIKREFIFKLPFNLPIADSGKRKYIGLLLYAKVRCICKINYSNTIANICAIYRQNIKKVLKY